ncbi:uncharacterized protein ACA1_063040 [Acanthamoeba castellanii str. Neff]|uniref:Uncharacterized protein n=1 Tax=Acanthamoeba castellanii (strain ATCC 30010 / Neff) TaxID=1257118 RepID=L8GX05_ACACF|nr:uncharacterized protein ACA1_063040 [Acanthamoeba castellanii str. Neff]ELR17540.1 hypothetical protein ACA1_063040 [Acanthamoeba castellanii str. Neff]
MFSSHGTEEEEYDYTHDEERRRQLRANVLEGLKIGDEEGEEGGADDNERAAAVDKNVNGAPTAGPATPSLTDRLPTFSPRKNQAFRNTFGFIAPGDIPTTDDAGAPAAPTKLRVSTPPAERRHPIPLPSFPSSVF